MTGTGTDIARAEAKAAVARERMNGTIAELKDRLNPAVRAKELLGGARSRGEVLADDAIEFAYERSGILIGLAGALVLLLAGKPLVRTIRPAFRRRTKWDAPAAHSGPPRHRVS